MVICSQWRVTRLSLGKAGRQVGQVFGGGVDHVGVAIQEISLQPEQAERVLANDLYIPSAVDAAFGQIGPNLPTSGLVFQQ